MCCVLAGAVGCASEPAPELPAVVDRAKAYLAAMGLVDVAAAASVSRDASLAAVDEWLNAQVAVVSPSGGPRAWTESGAPGSPNAGDPAWPDVACAGRCVLSWSYTPHPSYRYEVSGTVERTGDGLAVEVATERSNTSSQRGNGVIETMTMGTFVVDADEITGSFAASGSSTVTINNRWQVEATYALARTGDTCVAGTISIARTYVNVEDARANYEAAATVELDDCALPASVTDRTSDQQLPSR